MERRLARNRLHTYTRDGLTRPPSISSSTSLKISRKTHTLAHRAATMQAVAYSASFLASYIADVLSTQAAFWLWKKPLGVLAPIAVVGSCPAMYTIGSVLSSPLCALCPAYPRVLIVSATPPSEVQDAKLTGKGLYKLTVKNNRAVFR